MSFPRPEAGSRFDGPELMWLLRQLRREFRRGAPVPSLAELRARIAERRTTRYLDGTELRFLSMRQAAFILCRSKAYVRGLILRGQLSADYTPADESASGWAYWQISVDEVRAMAEAGEGCL